MPWISGTPQRLVAAMGGADALYNTCCLAAEEVPPVTVVDAAGPETFTFEELVRLLARAVGSRARIVQVPPGAGFALGSVVGFMMGDVVLTRDGIRGLMTNLLVSAAPPAGQVRFTGWLAQQSGRVGLRYASELARHYR